MAAGFVVGRRAMGTAGAVVGDRHGDGTRCVVCRVFLSCVWQRTNGEGKDSRRTNYGTSSGEGRHEGGDEGMGSVQSDNGRQLGWLALAVEQALSSAPSVKLVDVFADLPYQRTSLLLRAKHEGEDTEMPTTAKSLDHGSGVACDMHLVSELVSAAQRIVTEAIEHLDLRQHAAAHPRLGTVDHIVFHGLNTAANDQALADKAARLLAAQLHSTYPKTLPIFLYGRASPTPEPRQLQGVRRALGYFSGSATAYGRRQSPSPGSTRNAELRQHPHEGAEEPLPLAPDLGPRQAQCRTGVTCIGSTPWVTNLNVQLTTTDRAVARLLARRVSERHGGLPGVEAMALRHHDGRYEVACNLLVPDDTTLPDRVVRTLELACHELSSAGDDLRRQVAVAHSYIIGSDPASVMSA